MNLPTAPEGYKWAIANTLDPTCTFYTTWVSLVRSKNPHEILARKSFVYFHTDHKAYWLQSVEAAAEQCLTVFHTGLNLRAWRQELIHD